MSKGVIVSGYQISNALIAALLVASTAGAGVATDSFSGVTEGFDNPLSGPSENVTDVNNTDDSDDSSDSNSSDNQDSDSSDSDSGSSDSSDSDSSDSDDSSDSSEDDGGFLDDVLGGDEEQDSENQTDEQDNQNQDETRDNETEDTDTSDNTTTDSSVELPYIYQPDPAGTGPGQKIYDTMSVPVEIELIGENVNYEVKIDGETYFEGSIEGEETINTTVDMSNTGKHELEVDLTSSGEVLESVTRTFNISETTEDSTEFEWLGTLTANTDVGLRLWGDGETLSGETVSVDGEEIGKTNQDGEITVSIPYQDNLTLSTSYSGIQDKTYDIQGEAQEPQIVLDNPFDTESFDTQTGTDRDVTFEADVEITEDSGTASLMIDGSEAYTQDLSSGTNSISSTQALSGGTHNWQVEVDTPEYNVSSSSRSLTVNEVEVENGLSLRFTPPKVGDTNYVMLYDSGEPVEGTEITVNGDSIGTTDSNGEAGFEVPNTQEITVSASGYSDITRTVDGYTEPLDITADFEDTVYQNRQNTLTVSEDGSVLQGATVYAGGKDKGETDSNGQITFNVPDESSFDITVNKNDQSDTVTKQAYNLDFQISEPSEGGLVEDYGENPENIDFDVDGMIQSGISGTYSLILNGEQKYSSSTSSGETSISEMLTTTVEGSNSLKIRWDDGSTVEESDTVNFDAEWVENPYEFNLSSPDDGESINDYDAWLKYFVYYNITHNSRVYVELNGDIIDSTEFQGDTLGSNIYTPALSSGQHTWQLVLEDLEKNNNITSQQRTFTTEQNPPVALINLESPSEGQTFSSDTSIHVDYYTEVYEDSTHRVYVNGDTSLAPIKSLTQGEEGTYTFDIGTLDPGDYTVFVEAVSDSSGDAVATKKRQIQVE